MKVTEKIVGFIPQINENVKTLFENYLKKPRNLSLAENSAFVNPFYEKNPKYFQQRYNSIVKLLSLCVEMRNELDETVVMMCKAHNLRFVNPFSQKILVLS